MSGCRRIPERSLRFSGVLRKSEKSRLAAELHCRKGCAIRHALRSTPPPSVLTGTRAAELFRAAGVEPEYADARFLVLIATPFNTPEDFHRVEEAVESLPIGEPLLPEPALPPLPPVDAGLREAIFAASETVALEKSVGRIAAEAACPCPPGVPVVMPGERITEEAAEFLRGYGFFRIKVLK